MISRKILASTVAVSVALAAAVAPAQADDLSSGSTSLSSATGTGSSLLDTGSSEGEKTIDVGSSTLRNLSSRLTGDDTTTGDHDGLSSSLTGDNDGEEKGVSPIMIVGGVILALFLMNSGILQKFGISSNDNTETFSGSNGN